jgi:hypothetical protein
MDSLLTADNVLPQTQSVRFELLSIGRSTDGFLDPSSVLPEVQYD